LAITSRPLMRGGGSLGGPVWACLEVGGRVEVREAYVSGVTRLLYE
jgi:hypothetical protein